MNPILIAVTVLGGIGIVSAAVLYIVARKFNVAENPLVGEVEACLPGANCGACGFSGCHDFATNCVGSHSLKGKYCTVGGDKVMDAVGRLLGLDAEKGTPRIAVLRCNGSCLVRKQVTRYEGPRSCAIERLVYAGETDCQYGCLGCGDCVSACQFGAVTLNPATGLPEFDEEKCTACGQCVAACPGHVIELRNKGPKGRRVYVACSNHDRGAQARTECGAACIGCGLCAKACPFEAITVTDNLAYIDFEKCRLCRKCVSVCPSHCIEAVNFPDGIDRQKTEKGKKEVTC